MNSEQPRIRRHHAPLDWGNIRVDVAKLGGVIVKKLFMDKEIAKFNSEMDDYLATGCDQGKPASGSDQYDKFLGQRTVRLQGLIEKTPAVSDWIGKPELVNWATESMKPIATSVLLNAAELIQIGPG